MSIPLPVAGEKLSFSDWPKNNSDNDHRISNKEKVFNKISNKYYPYKKTTEQNYNQDFQIESEDNKNTEYVSSFLSKLPIYKSHSPKKNSTLMNSISYGDNNYYKGADGQLLDDGPPHVTLDELSSSPEKQPFSQKLKTMNFLPNFDNSNNSNNLNNKVNFFGNNNSHFNNINSFQNNNNNNNSIKSSPQKNNILNTLTSTGINKNLNSVIVYGFPEYLEMEIINHFKSFGEISSYDSIKENNWILITYRNSYSAKNALKYKNAFMFKNNIIGVMAHYDYLKLMKSNQSNMASNSNFLPSLNNLNNKNTNDINTISNQSKVFNNNNNNNNDNIVNSFNRQNINNTSPWKNNIFNNSPNNNFSTFNNNNNNMSNSSQSFEINSSKSFNKYSPQRSNSSSPQRLNSQMNIDIDMNQSNNFSFNMNTKSLKTFNINNNNNNNNDTINLFKKNSVRFSTSPDKNKQLTNDNTNHIRNFSSNSSMNISPQRIINSTTSNISNNNDNNNNSIFRNLFSSDNHKKENKLSDLTPTGTKFNPNLMSINNKNNDILSLPSSSSTKPKFSKTNPFASMLNDEENKNDKEEKPSYIRKSNIFHRSNFSSTNSLNSSITIPKIGNNKITKPNSSSNVKESNSGLLGKMVELVFGW